jgi:hypothetical protein
MKRVKAAGRSLRVTNAVARHASPLVGREGAGVVHAATATIDGRSDQVAAVEASCVLLITDLGALRIPWDQIDEIGATWLRLVDGTWIEVRHDTMDEHEQFVAAMPDEMGARLLDRIERAAQMRAPAPAPTVLSLLEDDPSGAEVATARVLDARVQTVVDGDRGGHVLLLQVEGRERPLVLLHPAAAGLPVPDAFQVETVQGWDDLIMSVRSPGPVHATWWQTPQAGITRVITSATWLDRPQDPPRAGWEQAPGFPAVPHPRSGGAGLRL